MVLKWEIMGTLLYLHRISHGKCVNVGQRCGHREEADCKEHTPSGKGAWVNSGLKNTDRIICICISHSLIYIMKASQNQSTKL